MGINITTKRAVSKAKAVADIVIAPLTLVEASGTGARLHLDARVGVSHDNSSRVSNWADQSGNGNNFSQPVLTLQPLISPPSSSLASVAFNNSKVAAYMQGVAVDMRGSTVVMVATLHRNPASTFEGLLTYWFGGSVWASSSTAVQNAWIVDTTYYNPAANSVIQSADGRLSKRTPNSQSETTPSGYPLLTRYSYPISNDAIPLSKRAGGVTAITSPIQKDAASISTSPLGLLGLGSFGANSLYADVDLHELAVFDKILTVQELKKVDTYIEDTYGSL